MEQNYSSTKAPTVGSNTGPGYPPNASWSNPSNITADDGSSASIGFFEGGQDGDFLVASSFGFQTLPENAIIDGIQVDIEGSNTGCYGDVILGITGAVSKSVGALNGSFGSSTDLWGIDVIDPADISTIAVTIALSDVSGGDGIASVEYMTVTVFWHIEIPSVPADVPTRFAYKVYSKDDKYLGELPNVTSKFAFTQDINTAGSTLQITCGQYLDNVTTVEPLLTESDLEITTESDLPILASSTDVIVATGNSDEDALFKNSNRVKVWMYNYWYPNGKLMFSGQINKVSFKFGSGSSQTQLLVYSDGLDLANYIARGYPFTYTTDQSQTSFVGSYPVTFYSYGGWDTFGQTFKTGGSVTNVGAIVLKLQGTANVTVTLYDAPNGNAIASVTKAVSAASATDIQFEFSQLVPVSANTTYFFAVWLKSGQTINMWRTTSDLYANGKRYRSQYSGGSGGGSFSDSVGGELYFITKYGTSTTTTTYSTQDPVTGMMTSILLDYNNRGGYITERDFSSTGLSLTYTFNSASIFDAMKKVLELSPTGYYSFIDLGTAEMDISPVSSTADFTVVRGDHINQLDMSLSIEQVVNYLLFSGGETAGVNLFRQYQDSESVSNYGIRMAAKSDNRVTTAATANAIGDTFIAEHSDESQETALTVLNTQMDITQLTPGKTIGFRNFGNFIDSMVLQIVRREFKPEVVTLTLGRLPITMNAEIQRINRALLFEQTIKNPSAPS